MAVLPAQTIESEIKAGRLIRNAKRENIEACSYDMRIGTFFLEGQIINGTHARATDQVIIQPGDVLSMFTEEELDLPVDVCGTAFPLNNQSSKGLLVLNPGHVDPGFKGPLTVKVLNLRRVPMAVTRGMEIFTVIFERLSEATDRPYSKSQTREKRERDFNANDVEIASRTLGQLITFGREAPFMTYAQVKEYVANSDLTSPAEVREIVRDHWISRANLMFSFAAALLAVLAVWAQLSESKSGGAKREASTAQPAISQTREAAKTGAQALPTNNAPKEAAQSMPNQKTESADVKR